MDWGVLRPAMLAAVQAATGLTLPGACTWTGSREATGRVPVVTAELSCSGADGIGTDEERAAFNNDTGLKDITISGPRTFNLTVRIETQDQRDAAIASNYADRLRARIRRSSVYALLSAAGIAIADIMPTQVLEGVKVENRVVSVAIVEFVLNAAENDRDDSPGSGNWIESMTGQSHYWTDPDGENSPTQSDIEVNT